MPFCPECSAAVSGDQRTCPTCGAALVATPTDADLPPQDAHAHDAEAVRADLAASLAPRYELLRPLGAGGMGSVFLAREPALKRLVAIKILAPDLAADPKARVRFEREARAAAALAHPNVVRVYAVGETADLKLPYIVMQYVEGTTLADRMSERRRASEREVRRILGEIAAALAAAHARDLVHRDVKPSNVLIEAASGRAYVADFGVSAALSPAAGVGDTRLTATGSIIGTPVYMSPEQAGGEAATPASDVYSLGILAYELITGGLPYRATTPLGWAAAHLKDTPTPVAKVRPDVSPEVAALVDRCLAKTVAERPAAAEVARGLLPSVETEIPWPPPGLQRHHRMMRGGNLYGVATIAAIVALALVLRFPPDTPGSGRFMWQAVAAAASIATALGCYGLFFFWVSLVEQPLRLRHLGWRPHTLLDVVSDRDGRTGLLLAGAREFAALADARRRQILLVRRGRALLSPVAATLAAAAGLAWAFAAVRSTVLADADGWLQMLWLISALGVTAIAGGAVVERALLGPLARRPAPRVAREDVVAWYAMLPNEKPAPPTPRWWRAAVSVAVTVGMLPFLVLLMGLFMRLGFGALVMGEVGGAAERQRMWGAGLSRAFAYGNTGVLQAAQRAAEFGAPAPSEEPAESTRRWVQALVFVPVQHPGPSPRGGSAPMASVRGFEGDLRGLLVGESAAWWIERAAAGRIRADTLALLARLDAHPRTILFRRLARADPLGVDLLGAALDRPADQYDVFEAPEAGSAARATARNIRGTAQANALTAALYVARGADAAARERLGENARVATDLFRAPSGTLNDAGRAILRSAALEPLAALAEARGTRPLAAALRRHARDVDELFDSLRANFRGVAALAADPRGRQALSYNLRNPAYPAGYRLVWYDLAWTASCNSPLEILARDNSVRTAWLEQLADSLGSEPHVLEFARLTLRRRQHSDRELGGAGSVTFLLRPVIYTLTQCNW